MKDFLSGIYIVSGVFALVALLVFLRWQFDFAQLALLGIGFTTALIVLFIMYGPGRYRDGK